MSKSPRANFAVLHDQFGSAGLVLSIVAIVLALGGGAYAANHSATASKAGKPGPRGKTGATGPAGPAGPPGANGTKGTNGANGVSVTPTALAEGEEGCEAGGVKYTSASGSNAVCNGEEGPKGNAGKQGEPWTPNNTLPPKASEHGIFDMAGFERPRVAISFPIPLAADLPAADIHFINEEQTGPASCEEGTLAEPKAAPGNLCIYGRTHQVSEIEPLNPETNNENEAGRSGVLLTKEHELEVDGIWVVTGAEE